MWGRTRATAAKKEAEEAHQASEQHGAELKRAIAESREVAQGILNRFMRSDGESSAE